MLLGGLWHGASYTFVIWGAYHGILLILSHQAIAVFERYGLSQPGVWFKRIFTFYLVIIGWVFFRAESLDDALKIIMAMHGGSELFLKQEGGILNIYWVILALIACHLVDWLILRKGRLFEYWWIVWPTITLFLVFAMLFNEPGKPFIYFQF